MLYVMRTLTSHQKKADTLNGKQVLNRISSLVIGCIERT